MQDKTYPAYILQRAMGSNWEMPQCSNTGLHPAWLLSGLSGSHSWASVTAPYFSQVAMKKVEEEQTHTSSARWGPRRSAEEKGSTSICGHTCMQSNSPSTRARVARDPVS